jgi:hypothetical protein
MIRNHRWMETGRSRRGGRRTMYKVETTNAIYVIRLTFLIPHFTLI